MAAEGESGFSSLSKVPSREGLGMYLAREARVQWECEVYEHNSERRVIEVIWQDWSSEVVAVSLEDWEPGRVALSCHMTMDFLFHEMRDACWDSAESLGSPCSLCSLLLGRFFSQKSGEGRDNKGEGCGEGEKEDKGV